MATQDLAPKVAGFLLSIQLPLEMAPQLATTHALQVEKHATARVLQAKTTQ